MGLSQGHILLEKLTIKPISGQDSYLTSLKLPIISGNGGYCYMDYHLSLLHILESLKKKKKKEMWKLAEKLVLFFHEELILNCPVIAVLTPISCSGILGDRSFKNTKFT